MKLGLGLALLAGLALATILVVYQGAGEVFAALSALGWGIFAVISVHVLQISACALGWRAVIDKAWPRPLANLIQIRWIREGTNGLLPLAHIGGEIIGARMLSFVGVRGDVAGASVVVDLTVEVVTQLLFTLVGLVLLVRGGHSGSEIADLAVGLAIAAIVLGGLVAAQRSGLFKLIETALDRLMAKAKWLSIQGVKGLHDRIRAIHRNPRALAIGAMWHLVSWLLGAAEVWVALHFMGVAIEPRDALILESLGQAARSAGFAIPGAVGIQEGGFMLFGAMLGISPEAALALSLAKRLRELALGLPAIAVWQFAEGRRIVHARKGESSRQKELGTIK